ncbi:MAG TPA: hypothetical protein VGF97_17050 [Rhizomicrobium sp.]|jgi:hypothetical protein
MRVSAPLRWLLPFAIFLAGVAPSQGKIVLENSDKGQTVALVGQIGWQDVGQFKKILVTKKLGAPLLVLESSDGGDAYAAMELGRAVRKNDFSVWVRDRCLSACALVYIAGVTRQNFGSIGLHRPYFTGTPMPPSQLVSTMRKMLADIHAYVTEMDVTDSFNDIMVNTDPVGMRVYAKKEIESLVPENDPIHDELVIAYWSRVYGISTEEYRRRRALADATCWTDGGTGTSPGLRGLDASQSCTLATYWGLPMPVFATRFAPALQKCPLGTTRPGAIDTIAAHWDDPVEQQHETCMRRAMRTVDKPVHYAIRAQFHSSLAFH